MGWGTFQIKVQEYATGLYITSMWVCSLNKQPMEFYFILLLITTISTAINVSIHVSIAWMYYGYTNDILIHSCTSMLVYNGYMCLRSKSHQIQPQTMFFLFVLGTTVVITVGHLVPLEDEFLDCFNDCHQILAGENNFKTHQIYSSPKFPVFRLSISEQLDAQQRNIVLSFH